MEHFYIIAESLKHAEAEANINGWTKLATHAGAWFNKAGQRVDYVGEGSARGLRGHLYLGFGWHRRRDVHSIREMIRGKRFVQRFPKDDEGGLGAENSAVDGGEVE